MTSKHEEQRPESMPKAEDTDKPDLKGPVLATTRHDLKAQEKPTEPSKSVKMTSPSGGTVYTSEENAETLRGAGYS